LERKIWDVNILAIYLVEDHPGNPYVSEAVEEGLRGAYTPVILGSLPLRAYWVMTSRWGIDRREAAAAVADFVEKYDAPEYVGLRRDTISLAFELAEELGHDVYDCAYLALALQEGASAIVTTDTDFEELAPAVGVGYENPVPEDVLRRFSAFRPRPQK